jgi:uncharacterized protein YdhG (YjbR/CyaY superfamily)
MKSIAPPDVDTYISSFPEETQAKLRKLRALIKKTAPQAIEGISYQMPAYKLNGPLVYFAGYKNHIGFYPGVSGVAGFKKELANYKFAKGSIQFPLDKPLPVDLIKSIVEYRVALSKKIAPKKSASKK